MYLKNLAYATVVLLIVSSFGRAQGPKNIRHVDPPIPADEIIKKFSEKEREFRIARGSYTYHQTVRVQTLTASDRVTGEYYVESDIVFDSSGKRTERITKAPPNTLQSISLTPEDMQDIREIQPFVLTSDDISKYTLKYLGKEMIDEIDCFVFDIGPKVMEKNQRYFQGQIWVDDKDLQIVKTYGKAVPDKRTKDQENLFPRFETYREQIDGKYWFPTYSRADEELHFPGGRHDPPQDVHIRITVKYMDYKRFGSKSRIIYAGEEVKKEQQQPNPPKK